MFERSELALRCTACQYNRLIGFVNITVSCVTTDLTEVGHLPLAEELGIAAVRIELHKLGSPASLITSEIYKEAVHNSGVIDLFYIQVDSFLLTVTEREAVSPACIFQLIEIAVIIVPRKNEVVRPVIVYRNINYCMRLRAAHVPHIKVLRNALFISFLAARIERHHNIVSAEQLAGIADVNVHSYRSLSGSFTFRLVGCECSSGQKRSKQSQSSRC